YNFSWNEEITEFHLGAYAGYHYFGGVRTLNNELYTLGANGFTNKLIGYTGALDIFTVDNFGTRFNFTYYPEVNNGDRFEFKGWTAKMGNYYAFGNRWWVASFGLDYGYGMRSEEHT